MNQKRGSTMFFYAQLGIIILIAISLIVLMRLVDTKLDEMVMSGQEALFIDTEYNEDLRSEFQDIILDFRPNSYKMIEVYSEDFVPIIRLQFLDSVDDVVDPITNHDNLIEFLSTHNSGYTSYVVNEKEQHIYFEWTKTIEGTPRLFIIYTSFPFVNNFWLIHTLCFVILGLVFILVLMTALRRYNVQIDQYKYISANVMRDELIH